MFIYRGLFHPQDFRIIFYKLETRDNDVTERGPKKTTLPTKLCLCLAEVNSCAIRMYMWMHPMQEVD